MRLRTLKGDLIQVRIASEDKRLMIDAARERGHTLSDFIRKNAIEAARQAVTP